MNLNNIDDQYKEIVKDILNDDEFNLMKRIEHHGITRYDHSLKVSYYAYKMAKKLRLDSYKTARAGLLHDFFLTDNDINQIKKIKNTFTHNKLAAKNAKNRFDLSTLEINIIEGHMFPLNLTVPKYAESWIVNLVDKGVALKEFSEKFGYRLNYATNFLFLVLLNFIKI